MIYLDTNVIVSYVNPRDPLHGAARRLIESLRSRGLVVSQLVPLELSSVYSRTMRLTSLEIEALVEYSLSVTGARLEQVDCDRLILEAKLKAPELKLRTLDLLHVTAAYLLGAEAIATFDRDIIAKRDQILKTLHLHVYTAEQ